MGKGLRKPVAFNGRIGFVKDSSITIEWDGDPTDPKTYGPAIIIAPGTTLRCSQPTRVGGRGGIRWRMQDGAIEWEDGARLVLSGYPVYVDGPESAGA